jgi:hypothetical protein
MPKSSFKNPFGRRKSAGNILDFAPPSDTPEPAASSTFRVIERANKSSTHIADGAERKTASSSRAQPPRPFDSPLQQIRGKSVEDVGSGQNRYVLSQDGRLKDPRLMNQRGSRGTTNSSSSGYYESSGNSARYSSTSTLPSSLEPEREPEDEDLFPNKRNMYSASNPALSQQPLQQPPSFTSRASRALSFGLKGRTPPPRLDDAPPVRATDSPEQMSARNSPTRERAMTTSSYASTAVPQKSERAIDLPTADFGNDFGNMFESFDKRPTKPSPAPPAAADYRRTVSAVYLLIHAAYLP